MGIAGILILFVIGLVAVVIEMFIPGIVLGVAGFILCIASIVLAFRENPTVGWVLLILGIMLTPVIVAVWVRVVSKYLAVHTSEEGYSVSTGEEEELLGQEGVAITKLRPSGMARIGDKRVNVVAEGELIPENTRIKVVKVEGNRIVVRPVRM